MITRSQAKAKITSLQEVVFPSSIETRQFNLRFKQIIYNDIAFAVATLQLLQDSKTNEERHVVDAQHAKYRTNKAKVLRIQDENGNDIKEGCSDYNKKFKYVVGEIVESEFDDNIDEVCTKGIHYFKTKEQAQQYLTIPHNGEYKDYGENGQLVEHYFRKNGLVYGEYKSYNLDGTLDTHCFYKDGNYDGEFKTYFVHGQIAVHCFYKDGKLDGEYILYYEDGELEYRDLYKDGKIVNN